MMLDMYSIDSFQLFCNSSKSENLYIKIMTIVCEKIKKYINHDSKYFKPNFILFVVKNANYFNKFILNINKY